MKDENEVMCRFCLDGTKTQINPLVDPCECKGSIQFVHKQCLIRWRHMDVERNGEVCYVCHTEYKIPLDMDLETIPESKLLYIYLDRPLLSNILAHYVWGVFRIFCEQFPTYLHLSEYGLFQLFLHSLLMASMIRRTKIKNWSRYIHRWSFENRWLFVVFHFLVFVCQLFGSQMLSLCLSNCVLQLYWKIHIDILREINQEVLHLN